MGWVGTVSSQMDWERLPVAPLYADVRAYCSHVKMYCKRARLLSSHPRLFIHSFKCLQTANKSASIHTNQILLSSTLFKNVETTMRWNCISKALRFLPITAEYQDFPFFTVFLTIKTLSQNISITLFQISLKPHEHRGGCWRKKLPWMILEQFPVPRNTAAN